MRQQLNALPRPGARDGARALAALCEAHGLEIRAVVPDLAVTIHAGLRRRHSRGRRGLDRLMAIAAVDAVVAYVVLVAELNWLLTL